MDPDSFGEVKRDFHKLLEAAGDALRIGDITAMERAAAVEFETEVSAVRFGLEEKLHATVLPDLVAVSHPNTANETVANLEDAVNTGGVMEQAQERSRAMFAGFLSEMLDLQCVSRLPKGVVPIGVEVRRAFGFSRKIERGRFNACQVFGSLFQSRALCAWTGNKPTALQ